MSARFQTLKPLFHISFLSDLFHVCSSPRVAWPRRWGTRQSRRWRLGGTRRPPQLQSHGAVVFLEGNKLQTSLQLPICLQLVRPWQMWIRCQQCFAVKSMVKEKHGGVSFGFQYTAQGCAAFWSCKSMISCVINVVRIVRCRGRLYSVKYCSHIPCVYSRSSLGLRWPTSQLLVYLFNGARSLYRCSLQLSMLALYCTATAFLTFRAGFRFALLFFCWKALLRLTLHADCQHLS